MACHLSRFLRGVSWLCLVGLSFACSVSADEKLQGIACRSVHFSFPAAEGVAFYHEVTVRKSARGTYFAVCGWEHGYFGLQELGNGQKLLIFSVWEPSAGNDPNRVAEARRVKVIDHDPRVRVGRFGGEGTGAQSFFDFDWERGTRYRFLVTASVKGERTEYAAHFFLPGERRWLRLATFATLANGQRLRGYYAFVEDFRRNRISATEPREALFGNGWIQTMAGQWQPLLNAQFTADANPVTNINAGVIDRQFRLATGGETKQTIELNSSLRRENAAQQKHPDDLP